MMLRIKNTDVWAAKLRNEPDTLALALQGLADAGANLECVITRRDNDNAERFTAFVTPIDGTEQKIRAPDLGFHPATGLYTLRVDGANRAGTGARITKAISDAGITMHGMSALTTGRRFVCYLGFDTEADRRKAANALNELRFQHWPGWPHVAGSKIHDPAITK